MTLIVAFTHKVNVLLYSEPAPGADTKSIEILSDQITAEDCWTGGTFEDTFKRIAYLPSYTLEDNEPDLSDPQILDSTDFTIKVYDCEYNFRVPATNVEMLSEAVGHMDGDNLYKYQINSGTYTLSLTRQTTRVEF